MTGAVCNSTALLFSKPIVSTGELWGERKAIKRTRKLNPTMNRFLVSCMRTLAD